MNSVNQSFEKMMEEQCLKQWKEKEQNKNKTFANQNLLLDTNNQNVAAAPINNSSCNNQSTSLTPADELNNFMMQFKNDLKAKMIAEGKEYIRTHTTLPTDTTKTQTFNVPTDRLNEMYQLMAKCIASNDKLIYAEKPTDNSILYFDFDLYLHNLDGSIPNQSCSLNGNFISEVLHSVYYVLKTYFNIANTQFVLTCKQDIQVKDVIDADKNVSKYLKDGLHLFVLNYSFSVKQRYFIRSKMLQYFATNKVMERYYISAKPNEDVIDSAIIDQNCVVMPGNMKQSGKTYRVYNDSIINYDGVTFSLQSCQLNSNLLVATSLRLNQTNNINVIEQFKQEFDSFTCKNKAVVTKYKPDGTKIDMKQIVCVWSDGLPHKDFKVDISKHDAVKNPIYFDGIPCLNKFENCLFRLPAHYYTDYVAWFNISCIIANHFKNETEKGFKVFNAFSSQSSDKYDNNAAIKKWNAINADDEDRKKLTDGTLYYWMQLESKNDYDDISEKFGDYDDTFNIASSYVWDDFKKKYNKSQYKVFVAADGKLKYPSEYYDMIKNFARCVRILDLVNPLIIVKETAQIVQKVITYSIKKVTKAQFASYQNDFKYYLQQVDAKGNASEVIQKGVLHLLDENDKLLSYKAEACCPDYKGSTAYIKDNFGNDIKVFNTWVPYPITRSCNEVKYKLGHETIKLVHHKVNRKIDLGIDPVSGKKMFREYVDEYDANEIVSYDFKTDEYKGIERILQHIYEVWCSCNPNWFKYYIQWFARILMEPNRKTNKIMLFYGKPGCGKSHLDEIFGQKMFGIHYKNLDATRMTKQFNSQTENLTFAICNEGKNNDKQTYAAIDVEVMKNIVDSVTLQIEEKGKEERTVDNVLNVKIITNNENCLDRDLILRKAVCFEMQSTHIKSDLDINSFPSDTNLWSEEQLNAYNQKVYYDELFKQAENNYRMFYDYLSDVYEPNFDLDARPITPYYLRLLNITKSNTEKFMEEVFTSAEDYDYIVPTGVENQFAACFSTLFDLYTAFCSANNVLKPLGKLNFKSELTKLGYLIRDNKEKVNGKTETIYYLQFNGLLQQIREENKSKVIEASKLLK